MVVLFVCLGVFCRISFHFVLFQCFLHFLARQGAPGSSHMFLALILESAISPKTYDSLNWSHIQKQDLGARYTYSFWGVLSFRPSQLAE